MVRALDRLHERCQLHIERITDLRDTSLDVMPNNNIPEQCVVFTPGDEDYM